MPWLVKGDEDPERNLLFVHVPRCGGTSLTKQFNVLDKSRQGVNLYHKIGMTYFFYRYALLETGNFPLKTIENMIAALQITIALVLFYTGAAGTVSSNCDPDVDDGCAPGHASIVMWSLACLSFVCSTFMFTAPVVARIDVMRRLYAILVGKILREFTASYQMLMGVGYQGYIVHFTAAKMLNYGHVTQHQFNTINNFAIVRNPFTRMISIYMYNRFGPCESFEHFVEVWYLKWKEYKVKGSTHEWDVYCHVLPQYEYTHMNGKQFVKAVILQENLKEIVKGNNTNCLVDDKIGTIPPRVLEALKAMPHANKRKRTKAWQDYYDLRTARLVREMYESDFAYYGYEPIIPGRPDLNAELGAWQEKPRPELEGDSNSDGTSVSAFPEGSENEGDEDNDDSNDVDGPKAISLMKSEAKNNNHSHETNRDLELGTYSQGQEGESRLSHAKSNESAESGSSRDSSASDGSNSSRASANSSDAKADVQEKTERTYSREELSSIV
mmetsp:Transcript_19720/g.36525  ORF Transcript_19720/g.36525 Transcript_19720/m.36525 type:complete len:498 (-) Transcript_19720:90-1583(-)